MGLGRVTTCLGNLLGKSRCSRSVIGDALECAFASELVQCFSTALRGAVHLAVEPFKHQILTSCDY